MSLFTIVWQALIPTTMMWRLSHGHDVTVYASSGPDSSSDASVYSVSKVSGPPGLPTPTFLNRY
jgi:hypothetical protein